MDVLCRQSLGQREEAERALARFEALEPNPAERGTLRATYLARNKDFTEADRVLAELLPAADAQQQRALQMLRISILQTSGATDRAKKLTADLIKALPEDGRLASPEDARVLSMGIELALLTKDDAAAELWENRLANLNSSDDYTWRVYRARRLLDQYEKLGAQDRVELAQLVSELRTLRPTRRDAVALSGRYADVSGNQKQAIEDYQLAISLGNRSPAIVERLVALLYADGRYTEAEPYLSSLSANADTSPGLDSLTIWAALRRNEATEAVSLARSALERHADDPVRHIWLANVLALDKKTVPEAEQTFQEALKRFPKDAARLEWTVYVAGSNQADGQGAADARGVADAAGRQFLGTAPHRRAGLPGSRGTAARPRGVRTRGESAPRRRGYSAAVGQVAFGVGCRQSHGGIR